MAESVIVKPSSQQCVDRRYIRVGLCFPCTTWAKTETVLVKLRDSVRHTIRKMPLLAGSVLVMPEEDRGEPPLSGSNTEETFEGKQCEQLKLHVTLEQVNTFVPVFNVLSTDEFAYTYQDLAMQGMPPQLLSNELLSPFPHTPIAKDGGDPAFAVQANFIEGGLLVAIFVHAAVANIESMVEIIKCMSSRQLASQSQQLTRQEFRDAARHQMRGRDESSVNTVTWELHVNSWCCAVKFDKAVTGHGTSCVIAMSMDMLHSITEMALSKVSILRDGHRRPMSWNGARNPHRMDLAGENDAAWASDCVVAILWKAVTRARLQVDRDYDVDLSSNLCLARRMPKTDGPSFEYSYPRAAVPDTKITAKATRLALPVDIGTITQIAAELRNTRMYSDDRVPCDKTDSGDATKDREIDLEGMDLLVEDWSTLNASLGMGIGPPEFVRKLSSTPSSSGCITLLPYSEEQGILESQVQLPHSAMEAFLQQQFLKTGLGWKSGGPPTDVHGSMISAALDLMAAW